MAVGFENCHGPGGGASRLSILTAPGEVAVSGLIANIKRPGKLLVFYW